MARLFAKVLMVTLVPAASLTAELPAYSPQARLALDKITAAKDLRDLDNLRVQAMSLLSTRQSFTRDDFAGLIYDIALIWHDLEATDPTQRSNSYYFKRIAREVLLDTDPILQAANVRALDWYPEQYSSAFDERSFQEARREAADLRLQLWRQFDDACVAAISQGKPVVSADARSQFPEERSQYFAQTQALNQWNDLILSRSKRYEKPAISVLAHSYRVEPVDFDELRGLVEHHMNGSRVTNAWESIVAALPPQFQERAVAAYAKPPVLTARHSLLPPIVPKPRPEPGLPAIAKASRIREGVAARGSQGVMGTVSPGAAVTGVEPGNDGVGSTGGRAVWPWVGLGLAGLAGAWGWLRHRG